MRLFCNEKTLLEKRRFAHCARALNFKLSRVFINRHLAQSSAKRSIKSR